MDKPDSTKHPSLEKEGAWRGGWTGFAFRMVASETNHPALRAPLLAKEGSFERSTHFLFFGSIVFLLFHLCELKPLRMKIIN
jgi:hypothetical protein